MRAILLTGLLAFKVGGVASAETVDVTLRNQAGEPVSGAVVTFMPHSGAYPVSASAAEITQKNVQFQPFTTVVPVGSEITFRNLDNILHHVFSFSKAKRFELDLFGKNEPKSISVEHEGIISVGCNIHDGMITYINVVSTPFSSQTDENGTASLKGLPATDGVLTVWHPLLREKGNKITRDVSVSAAPTDVPLQGRFRKALNISGDY